MVVKVAVLGGGINGVACALRIKRSYKDFEVVLLSQEFTPHTTGDGSGGLWCPYLCGSTPDQLITKWGCETYSFIHRLWLEGGCDVSLMPVYMLHRRAPPAHASRPAWASLVLGYRSMERKELEQLSRLYSARYIAGSTFSTFVVPPPALIARLYHEFSLAGGAARRAHVTCLRDPQLSEFRVVVNCTGLGARGVVPDSEVFPIRGQVSKVIAPWVNETIMDDDSGHYIIPNASTCVLGGTHQENDFNTQVDPKDTEFIFDGCTKMIPSLKTAEVVNTWVGLRPARRAVRVELQELDGQLIVHNYGHGGSGLTLFWGCATEVLSLLRPHFDNTNTTTPITTPTIAKSKL